MVACATNHTIVRCALDPRKGTLGSMAIAARVPGAPPSHQSIPLALSPARRRLYAATRSPPFLLAEYDLNQDGSLALIGTTPLAFSAAYLTADRMGDCLVAASYPDSCVAIIRLANVDRPVVSCVRHDIARAHCVAVAPRNDTVYVTELGRDRVLGFGYDAATGMLSSQPITFAQLRAGSGARHIALDAAATRLYCLNETDATIDVLRLQERGRQMHHLQTVALPGIDTRVHNQRAADVHLSPDGRHLYASERDRNTIVTFTVASDGRLEPSNVVGTETGPRAFKIDPSGRYMIVAGQASGTVSMRPIDPISGVPGPSTSRPAGAGASWIEIL